MAQSSTEQTTNPIINTILVISTGLAILEFSQLIFDPANAASLTNLEFEGVLTSMFEGLFLSGETLGSFWAVLIAWLIAGAVAGVRAKSGFWGLFAAFIGTLLSVAGLFAFNLSVSETIQTEQTIEYITGSFACILVAAFAAYLTGRALKPETVDTRPKERTRKAWVKEKEKEVWTCRKCGAKIPPGAFSCPKCGEAVIE